MIFEDNFPTFLDEFPPTFVEIIGVLVTRHGNNTSLSTFISDITNKV